MVPRLAPALTFAQPPTASTPVPVDGSLALAGSAFAAR